MFAAAALLVCATCPYASIQAAVAAAEPGQTVRVLAGRYEETVRIDRPLRLEGEGAVWDGGGQRELLVVAADGVFVSGFEFRRSARDLLRDTAALRVVRAGGCRIENNVFEDNFFAIYLEEARDCLVQRNEIRGIPRGEAGSANGIHAWNSSKLRIEHNRVSGHRDGIYLEFTNDSEILGNTAEANVRYGLHFMYADRNRFRHNRFATNGAGVAVMYSQHVDMEQNEFREHEGRASYGLLLKEISHSRLHCNRFLRNSVGAHFDESNHNLIVGNRFEANGLAVSLWASAEGNEFRANVFDGNVFDFHTNSTGETTNRLEGNYYSAYLGYDRDRDGYGDLPFRPFAYSAVLLGRYPLAGLLVKSPFFELLDFSERLLPSFAPAGLVDDQPALHPPACED